MQFKITKKVSKFAKNEKLNNYYVRHKAHQI